ERDDRATAAAEDVGPIDPVVVEDRDGVTRLRGNADRGVRVGEPAARVAPPVIAEHRVAPREQRNNLLVHPRVAATAGDEQQRRTGARPLRVEPGAGDRHISRSHVYTVAVVYIVDNTSVTVADQDGQPSGACDPGVVGVHVAKARPAAGGGRWVTISPERLPGWLDGFYGRHDGATEQGLMLIGANNGDTATLHPPPGLASEDVNALLAGLVQPPRIAL